MLMVGSHLQERNDSDLLMFISTYNKYAAQIAANTLFCCACSLHTPRILVESGIHKRMINLLKLISDHDLALRWETIFTINLFSIICVSSLVCYVVKWYSHRYTSHSTRVPSLYSAELPTPPWLLRLLDISSTWSGLLCIKMDLSCDPSGSMDTIDWASINPNKVLSGPSTPPSSEMDPPLKTVQLIYVTTGESCNPVPASTTRPSPHPTSIHISYLHNNRWLEWPPHVPCGCHSGLMKSREGLLLWQPVLSHLSSQLLVFTLWCVGLLVSWNMVLLVLCQSRDRKSVV